MKVKYDKTVDAKGQKGTGCFWLQAGYASIETADATIRYALIGCLVTG